MEYAKPAPSENVDLSEKVVDLVFVFGYKFFSDEAKPEPSENLDLSENGIMEQDAPEQSEREIVYTNEEAKFRDQTDWEDEDI